MRINNAFLTYAPHEWRLHALGHLQLLRPDGDGQHVLRPVQQRPHVRLDGLAAADLAVEVDGARGGKEVAVVLRALQRKRKVLQLGTYFSWKVRPRNAS